MKKGTDRVNLLLALIDVSKTLDKFYYEIA